MESTESANGKQDHPIFMGEWDIIKSLGEGNTSKVYLAVHKEDKKRQLRGDGWVEHILAAEWKRYAVRKFDSLTRGTPTNNSSLICC